MKFTNAYIKWGPLKLCFSVSYWSTFIFLVTMYSCQCRFCCVVVVFYRLFSSFNAGVASITTWFCFFFSFYAVLIILLSSLLVRSNLQVLASVVVLCSVFLCLFYYLVFLCVYGRCVGCLTNGDLSILPFYVCVCWGLYVFANNGVIRSEYTRTHC